ncbi:MAG: hypothetical protein HKN44_04095 [Ilumatobacter sp.]|nr:hypothetical protein [Ilumatobacter sp.]
MRLLLSGGSHRGSLGAIGAIGYFLWSEAEDVVTTLPGGKRGDRWSDVSEVVSVSGGSLANAVMAAQPGGTVEETAAQLAGMRRRLLHDRMLPWKSPTRIAATLALLSLAAATIALLLAAFGVIGPDVLSQAPWAVVIGLTVVPIALTVGRRLATWYLVDSATRITGGQAPLAPAGTGVRRHVISATGLASGVPYYFVSGGAPLEVSWGAALTEGYTTSDAAVASCSLPGVGLVRAPARYRREYLVDGGVSGVFGEQIDDTFVRRPSDTWRSDGDAVFAVDAARHLVSDSRLARVARLFSLVALVGRWLKVSLEATYVNDLLDLGPEQCARLCVPSTDGDGGELDDRRRRLDRLKERNAVLGLTSLSNATATAAIATGFVATLDVRIGLDDDRIEDGLRWLGAQLGVGDDLLACWQKTAS